MAHRTMQKTGWIIGIVILSILTLAALAADVVLIML